MEKCNSQFSPVAFKCERVKGHAGAHATREAFSTRSGGSRNMSPDQADLIDWFDALPRLSEAAAQPQPAPARNGNPAVTDLVLEDFCARDAFGARKYGTRLQPHNGRDALLDLYQELLDAACYTRQLIYERDGK